MRRFLLFLWVAGLPLFADEPRKGPPELIFGKFPLPIKGVAERSEAGLSSDKAEMDTPCPNDYPPNIEVSFEDGRENPASKKRGRYVQPAVSSVTVYRITDVKTAPHKTVQVHIERMQELLKKRPAKAEFNESGEKLPDYPQRNSPNLFHAKLRYVDAKWGSGVVYLAQRSQDSENYAHNQELTYRFQGISKDGNYYVSAEIRATHPKLPAGIGVTVEKGHTSEKDVAFLQGQPDKSFTPDLGKVREWLGTFQFERDQGEVPVEIQRALDRLESFSAINKDVFKHLGLTPVGDEAIHSVTVGRSGHSWEQWNVGFGRDYVLETTYRLPAFFTKGDYFEKIEIMRRTSQRDVYGRRIYVPLMPSWEAFNGLERPDDKGERGE